MTKRLLPILLIFILSACRQESSEVTSGSPAPETTIALPAGVTLIEDFTGRDDEVSSLSANMSSTTA